MWSEIILLFKNYIGNGWAAGHEEEGANERNPAKIPEIEQVEIKEIKLGERDERGEEEGGHGEDTETFRRQFALVLGMEEENLEVIFVV